MVLLHLHPLPGCLLAHPPCMSPPQVCSRAPTQQQYSSQNLTEIVHCFIALGEVPPGSPGSPRGSPIPSEHRDRAAWSCCSGSAGVTKAILLPAARSYPKELMKFFLSQMEMSKEAIRVGTLNLIRAVVSADGEHGQEGARGSGEAPGHPRLDLLHFLFHRHCWGGQGLTALSCFMFSILELKQHCIPPSTPSPLSISLKPSFHLGLNCKLFI